MVHTPNSNSQVEVALKTVKQSLTDNERKMHAVHMHIQPGHVAELPSGFWVCPQSPVSAKARQVVGAQCAADRCCPYYVVYCK